MTRLPYPPLLPFDPFFLDLLVSPYLQVCQPADTDNIVYLNLVDVMLVFVVVVGGGGGGNGGGGNGGGGNGGGGKGGGGNGGGGNGGGGGC